MRDKILAVDDDATFLKSLKKVLTLKKYLVDTADSAALAEVLLGQNGYSCILLDVKMPDVKELDLLKTALQKYPPRQWLWFPVRAILPLRWKA